MRLSAAEANEKNKDLNRPQKMIWVAAVYDYALEKQRLGF